MTEVRERYGVIRGETDPRVEGRWFDRRRLPEKDLGEPCAPLTIAFDPTNVIEFREDGRSARVYRQRK